MKEKTLAVRNNSELLRKYSVFVLLIILVLFNCIFTNNFFAINTLWNAVIQSTTSMLLALGMMLVIATGGIDISVGANVALTSTIMVYGFTHGLGYFSILLALICGGIAGTCIGFLVAKMHIQPMIVTLGFMTILRGIAQYLTDCSLVPLSDPFLKSLAYYRIGGVVPFQLIVVVVFVAAFTFFVKKTRYGMYIEAYGDSARATELVGVRTLPLLMMVYIILGVVSGFGGINETLRICAADPSNTGLELEMDAIAAVAIGGTSMTGGRMSVGGTVAGVFLLQVITMMINMNNIPYQVSLLIKACIIVLSIVIQKVNFSKRKER